MYFTEVRRTPVLGGPMQPVAIAARA